MKSARPATNFRAMKLPDDPPAETALFFRTVHFASSDKDGVAVTDALKVPGIVRFIHAADSGDRPHYEVWWLNEERAAVGLGTKEFAALGLAPKEAAGTVTDLATHASPPRWRHGPFYWSKFVVLMAFLGYVASLSDTWNWLFGTVNGVAQVEIEETLKPHAIRTPFHIVVAVHNSKRYGTLQVTNPPAVLDLPATLKVSTATSTGEVTIEPGKTEKFDYVVEASEYGKKQLRFDLVVSAGVLQSSQHLVTAPVNVEVWQGHDSSPELVFKEAVNPNEPTFEVVIRNGLPRSQTEVELTFLNMDVVNFEQFEPDNAASAVLIKSVYQSDQTLKRLVVKDPSPLREVRLPFTITTATPKSLDEWKQTRDITVFTQ